MANTHNFEAMIKDFDKFYKVRSNTHHDYANNSIIINSYDPEKKRRHQLVMYAHLVEPAFKSQVFETLCAFGDRIEKQRGYNDEYYELLKELPSYGKF